jgi:hypothetical protein
VIAGETSVLALSLSSAEGLSAGGSWGGGAPAGPAAAAAPTAAVAPASPADFDRFLCCVEFLRYGLPMVARSGAVARWTYPLVRACVHGASAFPHVSGYLTVLTVAMALAENTGYFAGGASVAASDAIPAGDEPTAAPDAAACYSLIDAFADEVLQRCKQYKAELLFAALQVDNTRTARLIYLSFWLLAVYNASTTRAGSLQCGAYCDSYGHCAGGGSVSPCLSCSRRSVAVSAPCHVVACLPPAPTPPAASAWNHPRGKLDCGPACLI